MSEKPAGYGESDAENGGDAARPIPSGGIGRRISSVLDRLGTRRSAALIAGVSVDSLQRYVTGKNMPPFDVMARLCAAAGASMEWVASGDGDLVRMVAETAPGNASQPLRRDELTMALQLASEALGNRELPPAKHAELVTLIYELLEEGLPEAKVLRFARAAAA